MFLIPLEIVLIAIFIGIPGENGLVLLLIVGVPYLILNIISLFLLLLNYFIYKIINYMKRRKILVHLNVGGFNMDKQSKLYLSVIVPISAVVVIYYWHNIAQMSFYACVYILEFLGQITFLGYVGINVLLFCVFLPVYLFYSVYIYRKQNRTINKLKDRINYLENTLY